MQQHIEINRTSIAWIVGISALVLFISSSLRHALFQSTALDLAVFDQWIYLTSQGLPPISSFFGFHMIGDHAAFILYPIALLYKIYPDVHWLFFVQAIALALGAIPVYSLSLQAKLSPVYGRAIAIAYLLYPSLFNSNFFTDFRPESIAIPALLWAIWAAIGRKTSQFIIAILLALICKDSWSLTIIFFGIWLWIPQKRSNYGIACIVLGIAWYLATVNYLVPLLRGGEAGGVVFYGSIGDSPKDILINLFTNPSLVLGKVFDPEALFYYLLLILPVTIAVHWKELPAIIPALPMLLLNIISDYSAQRDLVHHYSLPIFPFLIIWLLNSVQRFQAENKRHWLTPKILIIWSLITFLALAKYEFFITRYLSSWSNIESLHKVVRLVETDGSVLTTARIAPHLSHRQIIKQINPDWQPDNSASEIFDYIVLDFRSQNNTGEQSLRPDLKEELTNSGKYSLKFQKNDVLLFVKN